MHAEELSGRLIAAGRQIAVGGLYVTLDSTDPSLALGYGSWVQFGAGDVLVGVNSLDPDFTPAGKTGGSKTQTF